MTRIKICGLTREADIEAAVEAGADAIGFVFYAKSARAVTPERAKALKDAIKNVTSMIEPIMIVLMGSVVGFIAMAIILPIFKMSSLVTGH
jgi:phosphoribosylanthranilate isomerase